MEIMSDEPSRATDSADELVLALQRIVYSGVTLGGHNRAVAIAALRSADALLDADGVAALHPDPDTPSPLIRG